MFRNFALADKANNLTTEIINNEADYVRMRLRQELASASYSNEASAQVLLEVDPQVLKAIEVMGESGKLAERNIALNRW
ncbi:hypothetical protein [Leptolyngbya sp. 7M]|uniref:hypothetical protein n=1 Tax=Leptolyngbya sp. 7M TaxID=2812896 RepID=UPI001B8C149C|nr:hypothetical protein [Leptolyngbya sp. 7M]QYO67789.1 hypothetical protein JVX88_13970 [Leptolyngbya sp. 7M]